MVDPRDDPARLYQVEKRVEVLRIHVRAGWVVADTLLEKNIARLGGFQPVKHLVMGDLSHKPVAVWCLRERRIGRSQDWNVVALGRCLQPEGERFGHLRQKIRDDYQADGSARSLC